MPESCFICLDSTEYMRNGDYYPNRMFGMLEFVNFLVEAKMNKNAENTVGFLCAGGNACDVKESLTADVDRILASLASIKIKGKVCHFSAALRIAALALSHRSEPRSEKRIAIFMGSPLRETPQELHTLAHKLRKDNVAVDVVTFGVPDNVEPLQHFVEKVNKDGNSCFVSIPEGKTISEVLMDSPVFTGPEAVSMLLPTSEGAGGAAGGNLIHNFGFSIDPNADPDLQRALQLSMEEEMQRQAAAASSSSNANNQQEGQGLISAGGGPTVMNALSSAPTLSAFMAPHSNARPMTFEEELQQALLLSLQEAAVQEENRSSPSANPSHAVSETSNAPAQSSEINATQDSEKEKVANQNIVPQGVNEEVEEQQPQDQSRKSTHSKQFENEEDP